MKKIFKGQLHIESWPERYQFSKQFAVGTKFSSEQLTRKLTLYFWSSTDAQPCFSISNSKEDVQIPSDLTLTTSDGKTLSVCNITDVSERISEIGKKRDIETVIKSTNGYISLE